MNFPNEKKMKISFTLPMTPWLTWQFKFEINMLTISGFTEKKIFFFKSPKDLPWPFFFRIQDNVMLIFIFGDDLYEPKFNILERRFWYCPSSQKLAMFLKDFNGSIISIWLPPLSILFLKLFLLDTQIEPTYWIWSNTPNIWKWQYQRWLKLSHYIV